LFLFTQTRVDKNQGALGSFVVFSRARFND
jgi:hypothetical protein